MNPLMGSWFAGEIEVNQFLHRLGIKVISVTEAHAELAPSAYNRLGKEVTISGLDNRLFYKSIIREKSISMK